VARKNKKQNKKTKKQKNKNKNKQKKNDAMLGEILFGALMRWGQPCVRQRSS
jgi:hypothetical protein